MNSVQNSQMIDVLDVLEACKPTIYRLAHSYEVDAEDLAVKMLEDPRRLENPKGYYTVKARYMAIDRAPRDLSLDAPAYDSPDLTLADILPAGPVGMEADYSTTDTRAETLYTALSKLPLDEQEYLCSVYKLTAYTPTDTGVQLMPRFAKSGPRSRPTIQVSSYYHIRKDQELLRAVQETYAI